MKSRCGRENSLSAAPVPSGVPVRRAPAAENAAAGISRKKDLEMWIILFIFAYATMQGSGLYGPGFLFFYVFCFLERRAGRHFRKIIELWQKRLFI